jgi:lysophospholipase L1-like esterase
VLPEEAYDDRRGYGLDLDSRPIAVDRGGADPLRRDFMAGKTAFFFSVRLPEGNYDVTATFGDHAHGSTNAVKAESRRLMLERVVTAPGEFVQHTFTVNIHTPDLGPGRSVRLKPREQGVLHWDDKLTLEFNGSRPAVCGLEITPAHDAVTVFLLGDSTVTDQPQEPWNSWGQMLTRFFKPGVAVANHAESGESVKSALSAGRVEKVLTSMRAGDYLFVQFGHNDMKDRATNALATYRANLRQLVDDVRARGGTPVLLTSMERKAGIAADTLGKYPATVREVAREKHVSLIDLHVMSRILYQALGDQIDAAFQDGTHHNAYGSYELARCVALGIRQNDLPLAEWLTDDLPDFDPARPDDPARFSVPASGERSSVKPDGN